MDNIIQIVKRVNNYLEVDELPPKEYDITKDWQCKYCGFRDKCYSERELIDNKCNPSKKLLNQ